MSLAATSRRALVITTCSAGKRWGSALTAATLPRASQAAVAAAWLARLRAESAVAPADTLYRGRAFETAQRAAARIGADFAVFSAGLGYIRGGERIPSYDLTVRAGVSSSVVARVSDRFDAAAWWRAVASGPFAADLADDLRGRDTVLVCLSRPYAAMVQAPLTAFAREAPSALRLFGLPDVASLPPELRTAHMPYDARLELLGVPGTRVDFPQRALADFVDHVFAPTRGADRAAEQAAVLQRLAEAPAAPPRRVQRRVSDAVLRRRIADLVEERGLGSSALLAHLRRVEHVSCEQRRFAALYRDVRTRSAT